MLHIALIYCLLFISSLLASLIDTLAGGGGLITLPILLMMGLPPHLALGTNKMQSTFGSGSAVFHLFRHQQFELNKVSIGFIFTFIGGSIGALSVLRIKAEFLESILPGLLFIMLIYISLSKLLKKFSFYFNINKFSFILPCGLLLGFYDGFLGPATGSLWVVLLMIFTAYNLQQATIHAKIFSFSSNVAALTFFILHQQVFYQYALIMALGQIIGARISTHFIIYKGHQIIKPTLIAALAVMLLILDRNSLLSIFNFIAR